MKKILYGSLFLLIFAGSCTKEPKYTPSPAPSPYYIRMTDAPAAYNAVNIDLQAVEIKGNNGSSVMLNVNPGIYNLLDFSNGLDTLIASGSLQMSRVEQIRLILGSNNTIVLTDGSVHPLSTPSAQQSGLKLQVHQDLQPGIAYYVLLDFDAAQSIVVEGNGTYSLKPVIRTIEAPLSGSIKGQLSVSGVPATVTATSGSLSYSTVVNANGEFIVAGLPPGVYTLTINPAAPYNTVTMNNITVTVGVVSNVGIVPV
jgi:hypothetical protein